MALQKSFRLLSSRALSQVPCRIHSIQRRWLATPIGAADAATLPLAGIKVLDMTRVLAGVRFHAKSYQNNRLVSNSHTRHKY